MMAVADYLSILRSVVAHDTGCEESELGEERVSTVGLSSLSSLNSQPNTRQHESFPPPDRPIRDDHAKWLLTLSPVERREWWRSVAVYFNRSEDWSRAEAEAVAYFTNRHRAPIEKTKGVRL